jgi:hypothetical protein
MWNIHILLDSFNGCRGQKAQFFCPYLDNAFKSWVIAGEHFMDSPLDEPRWEVSPLSEGEIPEVQPCTIQKGRQGRRVAGILKTFDYSTSKAWMALTNQFGSGVRHREFRSVAVVISKEFGVPRPPRDAQRSYPVLIKWFQDNLDAIEPILPFVGLLDDDEKLIDGYRERGERKTSSLANAGDETPALESSPDVWSEGSPVGNRSHSK